jgi:hypothetical protein
MDRKSSFQTLLAAITVISVLFVSLGGCSPAMRKKFVREKKKEEVEIISHPGTAGI